MEELAVEDLRHVNSSLDNIGVTSSTGKRWAKYAVRFGVSRGAYRDFVEKLEGKKPLGNSKGKWEGSTRIDLKDTGWWRGLDWSYSV
jgi:hypothetical protein